MPLRQAAFSCRNSMMELEIKVNLSKQNLNDVYGCKKNSNAERCIKSEQSLFYYFCEQITMECQKSNCDVIKLSFIKSAVFAVKGGIKNYRNFYSLQLLPSSKSHAINYKVFSNVYQPAISKAHNFASIKQRKVV